MKETIYELLCQLRNMIDNPEMTKWAQKLDAKGHGADASATHIRTNLSAVARECKNLRVEIQERRNAIVAAKKKKK